MGLTEIGTSEERAMEKPATPTIIFIFPSIT